MKNSPKKFQRPSDAYLEQFHSIAKKKAARMRLKSSFTVYFATVLALGKDSSNTAPFLL